MMYSATELEEIMQRHRDADKGAYLIGLALAALSGAAVTVLGFIAARWING